MFSEIFRKLLEMANSCESAHLNSLTVVVNVGEILEAHNCTCSVLDEAKENNRMVKELKKCFSLLKSSVVNLHNRKLNQGVLKEIEECFDEVRDFVASFQGQGWFKKCFWKRSENKSESGRLMKQTFRINELLQTDILAELNRCEEEHRKFRDEVIDGLEQVAKSNRQKEVRPF
eukprot:jgi/Bigna1/144140/aug1.84_g18848